MYFVGLRTLISEIDLQTKQAQMTSGDVIFDGWERSDEPM